jgi:hypothetical protein
MGKPDDPMAVVDTQGRVYGVRGLRVVDASIFPSLPPGHPMATVCKLFLFFLWDVSLLLLLLDWLADIVLL